MEETRSRGGRPVDVLHRRVLEQEALLALARCALEDPERVLRRACELTAAVLEVPWVDVVRLAPDGPAHRLALNGPEVPEMPPAGTGPAALAVRDGAPHRCDDLGADPALPGAAELLAAGIRSELAVPVPLGQGSWAALAAHSRSPGAFSTDDERFLVEAAALLAAAARAVGLGAERERRQHERRALDAAGDGLAMLDPSGRITYANRSFAALLGTEPAALVGADLHEAAHHTRPDGSPYPRQECAIVRACATGEALDTERQLMFRADGGTIHLSATVRPVPADGGPAGVVLSLRDVEGVVRAEVAVAESERRHRAVVDSLTEGVVVQDAEGVVVSANPAALRLLRLPEDRLLGSRPDRPLHEAVDEAGTLLRPQDLPTAVALRTGLPVRGQVLGCASARRPPGSG